MRKAIIIKKYKNRRLYDADSKCYTSLERIARLIQEGHEVRVEDNDTQEEITSEVLLQIVLDLNKKPQNFLPSDLLHQIICHGGNWPETWRAHWGTSMSYLEKFKQNMSQQFQSWQNFWHNLVANSKASVPEEKKQPLLGSSEELMAYLQACLAEYEKKILELENQFKEHMSQQLRHWNQLRMALLVEKSASVGEGQGEEVRAGEVHWQFKQEEIFSHVQHKIREYEEKIHKLETQLKSIAALTQISI